ncbi:hypothetical protein EYF80_031338 [Liparis tanakae]|uniref:Uncharacterized protein n=1 Tax=Liparis tanakae TaxID=230148 RepID=A0A4Z2GXR2_9TELE|nr:hypothetical protein EYF80_031338 [Liparis tanakae]
MMWPESESQTSCCYKAMNHFFTATALRQCLTAEADRLMTASVEAKVRGRNFKAARRAHGPSGLWATRDKRYQKKHNLPIPLAEPKPRNEVLTKPESRHYTQGLESARCAIQERLWDGFKFLPGRRSAGKPLVAVTPF